MHIVALFVTGPKGTRTILKRPIDTDGPTIANSIFFNGEEADFIRKALLFFKEKYGFYETFPTQGVVLDIAIQKPVKPEDLLRYLQAKLSTGHAHLC